MNYTLKGQVLWKLFSMSLCPHTEIHQMLCVLSLLHLHYILNLLWCNTWLWCYHMQLIIFNNKHWKIKRLVFLYLYILCIKTELARFCHHWWTSWNITSPSRAILDIITCSWLYSTKNFEIYTSNFLVSIYIYIYIYMYMSKVNYPRVLSFHHCWTDRAWNIS